VSEQKGSERRAASLYSKADNYCNFGIEESDPQDDDYKHKTELPDPLAIIGRFPRKPELDAVNTSWRLS
jgi:hypothetical protein